MIQSRPAVTLPQPVPSPAPDLLREPAPDALERTFLAGYLRWLRQRRRLDFSSYEELQAWSVRDLEGFWGSVWEYFEVRDKTGYTRVLAEPTLPGSRWFAGSTVNYAENALLGVGRVSPQDGAGRPDTDVAIVGVSQTRDRVELTFAQLRDKVALLQQALRRLGVGKGDRVAGYLPNAPEAVVAFLATASLGAIWAGCAPEFGPRAVIDRFAQLEPKVLFAVTGYRYGDKPVPRAAELEEIRAALPTLEHTVVVNYGPFGSGALDDVVRWADLLEAAPEQPVAPPEFEPVDFAHPLCILFSSGTSGKPKAIIHSHGGFLAEHLKNHALSWDLQAGDTMMWSTTTAWMVWNSLVSALLLRATIVMVDGNPLYPDLHAQWRLAEELRPSLLGVSPGYIMACQTDGLEPAKAYDLGSIRTLGASGSPLPEAGYRWVRQNFGPEVVFNIGSGGTDVCTAFVQSGPWQRDWAGEMSGKCLGVDVAAVDELGREVVDGFGELVVRAPMPSMPVGFWADTDGSRYRAAYFEEYPGIWWHGDRIRFRSDTGSCIITGRSDATLNRGGVRLGTAEYYNVLEARPDIADSLVVHLEDPDGGNGELILFVSLRPGSTLDAGLRRSINDDLRRQLSPRHVPDRIVEVAAVPRNRTGKKLEIPVKRILNGMPAEQATSLDSLAVPGSLDPVIRLARELGRHGGG